VLIALLIKNTWGHESSSNILTLTTESLAATAIISAHETTLGHKLSSWDLMVSITSKPLKELAFGPAVFSPVKLDVSSNNSDASHPYNQTQDCLTKW
jgi:hypothetical protein